MNKGTRCLSRPRDLRIAALLPGVAEPVVEEDEEEEDTGEVTTSVVVGPTTSMDTTVGPCIADIENSVKVTGPAAAWFCLYDRLV